jgi:hypothetical protein
MITPRKPEHANKHEHVGKGYMIERRLMGYSYPRNGNVHNATPQYHWVLYLNGKQVDSDPRRTPLRRAARRDDYR